MSAVQGASFVAVWTSIVMFSSSSSPPSEENVTAVLGEDVTLHCEAPRNATVLVVEWNRPDVHPQYILIYRDERFYPEYQNPAFRNRVELRGLQKGDVSLILRKVTTDDAGTYECYVLQSETNRRQRRMEPTSIIHLKVVPEKSSHQHYGLTAGVLLVVPLLFVALVIHRKNGDHRVLN